MASICSAFTYNRFRHVWVHVEVSWDRASALIVGPSMRLDGAPSSIDYDIEHAGAAVVRMPSQSRHPFGSEAATLLQKPVHRL
jgi:hypothetical protein